MNERLIAAARAACENLEPRGLDAAARLEELRAAADALAAQPAAEPTSIHLQDLKNALAESKALRDQLRLMEEQAKGEVWRWQGDGTDNLDSMGARMGVLIYASDLKALIAAQPVAKPACEQCGGTGEVLAHAENCHDDLCALNGDEHSCAGHVEPCSCAAQTAAEPTDAMVDAYLQAQRRAVEEADRFGRPNIGGLHTNTVREACRAGLRAAIAVAAQPARAGGDAPTVDAMVDKAWGRFEAETQRLNGLKQRFFAFDEEVGFDTYDTAEQAQAAAEESIAQYRAGATDEWDSDVENVCWGVILGRPEEVEVGEPNDDGERAVDYRLAALAAAPQPALAERPSPELAWLYGHCKAIGMTKKSDSGKWEHDIALFTIDLQQQAAEARQQPAGGAVPSIDSIIELADQSSFRMWKKCGRPKSTPAEQEEERKHAAALRRALEQLAGAAPAAMERDACPDSQRLGFVLEHLLGKRDLAALVSIAHDEDGFRLSDDEVLQGIDAAIRGIGSSKEGSAT